MKKLVSNSKEVISWLFFWGALAMFLCTLFMNVFGSPDKSGIFLFGYRPVLVLSESMEPYMMTNSIALTKAVSDIDDIQPGDVISFLQEDTNGSYIRNTHRITEIRDGKIYTKGDNNSFPDSEPVTFDAVEAKVIHVFNGFARLIDIWGESLMGKAVILCSSAGFILALFFVKPLIVWARGKTNARRAVQS